MRDRELLLQLLDAETEEAALEVLNKKGLLSDPSRWRPLGNMPNNQSVVHAQQSSPSAALVEKFTNGLDAILLRRCKAESLDPRSEVAPKSMPLAVERYFGDLDEKTSQEIRAIAEENLILYATGTKARPSLSIYDAGEGQLPQNFQNTFCSLVYGSNEGSYKGAVPFVQGRFNMGGTGVLPFCGDQRKLQLIVSRVPDDVESEPHEWGFTVFCFFASKQSPSWKYLIGPDGNVLTGGLDPIGLVPKTSAKSGEICAPRERRVKCGTLIKMYDYKAPLSNICGELYKKLTEYLLRPSLPLRIVECRPQYQAKVMGVTIWDRLSSWGKDKLEEDFEDGASVQVKLSTGEVVPAEIRVFKALKDGDDESERPQTGLRALINGQSHAKRDASFFRTKAVDKEHIASSMLVTLDCSELGQDSRNALFMSNRENFREDPLLNELFKGLQRELSVHPGLIEANQRRFEEKVKNATTDNEGIEALEELLTTDPDLAELFGSLVKGAVGARNPDSKDGKKIEGKAEPYVGMDFPSYFKRKSGEANVENIEMPLGTDVRVSFITDVKNNYFTRKKHRGVCTILEGNLQTSWNLFKGRLTYTLHADKKMVQGDEFRIKVRIQDNAGHGPFELSMSGKIGPAREKSTREKKKEDPKVDSGPSRPDIKEVMNGPEDPPLIVDKDPKSNRLQLLINKGSKLLADAKQLRNSSEEIAVEFVFKYGLALVAMGLIDSAKKTADWEADEAGCRAKIQETAIGIARVIVPLCLTLPKKLPKAA